ncbi:zinc ribbon domain-containing protein [Salicibibacter cibi]|uniref:Zinc ribbon domain-containing protein n=1 Tax=Salicibibacter cibi TaxID=2743001 RepID=A0A7T6Z8E8_9BACI|nr:zinc ribbon domain-containing protein [Salicibibacter cibi]QQK78759.1 zinc ribbon domain-containing protein [Salicibibacter cibi]
MKCHACHYELSVDDNFCEHCGQKVQRHDEIIEAARAESAGTIEEREPEQEQGNADFDQVKENLYNYWTFFLTALKSPFNAASAITGTKNQMIYGIITIALVAIILPLIFTSIVSTLSPWSPDVPVVSPIIYLLIFLALTIGGMFVVVKMGKSSVSFQRLVASFGSMMVIPLAILILSLLLTLVNVLSLGIIFLFAAMTAFNLAIVYTVHLFLKDSTGGLDTFYGALIVLTLLAVILYVFGESLTTSFLNDLESMNMF